MPPPDTAPPCRNCMAEPADEDGFCSDLCELEYDNNFKIDYEDGPFGD